MTDVDEWSPGFTCHSPGVSCSRTASLRAGPTLPKFVLEASLSSRPVLKGPHPCHPHVYPPVEWAMPVFTPPADAEQYRASAGTYFPSCWGQEARVGLGSWLYTQVIFAWSNFVDALNAVSAVLNHQCLSCELGALATYALLWMDRD